MDLRFDDYILCQFPDSSSWTFAIAAEYHFDLNTYRLGHWSLAQFDVPPSSSRIRLCVESRFATYWVMHCAVISSRTFRTTLMLWYVRPSCNETGALLRRKKAQGNRSQGIFLSWEDLTTLLFGVEFSDQISNSSFETRRIYQAHHVASVFARL